MGRVNATQCSRFLLVYVGRSASATPEGIQLLPGPMLTASLEVGHAATHILAFKLFLDLLKLQLLALTRLRPVHLLHLLCIRTSFIKAFLLFKSKSFLLQTQLLHHGVVQAPLVLHVGLVFPFGLEGSFTLALDFLVLGLLEALVVHGVLLDVYFLDRFVEVPKLLQLLLFEFKLGHFNVVDVLFFELLVERLGVDDLLHLDFSFLTVLQAFQFFLLEFPLDFGFLALFVFFLMESLFFLLPLYFFRFLHSPFLL